MKFGARLTEVSVPRWSVHNVDYDSLKHQIKAHTTKDQAVSAAITIPGHQDRALQRFEGDFYNELYTQHNRIYLFVTSKADEISRRLRHISGLVHRLMVKCADARGLSHEGRQRRFAKYQVQTEECGRDIASLVRFVDAQVTGFRKILKKYKKWTSSAALSYRFKNDILDSPKSLSRYDFTPLQLQYRELCTTLEAAPHSDDSTTAPDTPTSPDADHTDEGPRTPPRHWSRRGSKNAAAIPPVTYWNEYEHGSEAGDDEDGAYVIYIEPDHGPDFPGVAYVKSMLGAPVDQMRSWLNAPSLKDAPSTPPTIIGSPSETHSLIGRNRSQASSMNYFTMGRREQSTDYEAQTEDEFLSSDDSELQRHEHSLPFVSTQTSSADVDTKPRLYQDIVLTRSIVLAFIASFMLLGVSGLLVATGRRRLRLEVDMGAAAGSVASLLCACTALGTMLYRQYPHGYIYSLAVWVTFIAACTLNGAVLLMVVSNSGVL
ncbi:hypothetical protein GGR50DRAFT_691364 [Xylaria sp. CBS 124048]|nr:hypothetical protein GGR50DRAFT_691364 [Xylaria sp. CBS 124048]